MSDLKTKLFNIMVITFFVVSIFTFLEVTYLVSKSGDSKVTVERTVKEVFVTPSPTATPTASVSASPTLKNGKKVTQSPSATPTETPID